MCGALEYHQDIRVALKSKLEASYARADIHSYSPVERQVCIRGMLVLRVALHARVQGTTVLRSLRINDAGHRSYYRGVTMLDYHSPEVVVHSREPVVERLAHFGAHLVCRTSLCMC